MPLSYPSEHDSLQTYFPDPVYIAAGNDITIPAVTHLPYNVFFWDGNGGLEEPFDWPGTGITSGPLFFVANIDIVLAIDKQLTVESYYLGLNASEVADPVDRRNAFVGSFFFDSATGNIHTGIVKFATGINTGWTWRTSRALLPMHRASIHSASRRTLKTERGITA